MYYFASYLTTDNKKTTTLFPCAKWIYRPPRHTPVEHLPGQCILRTVLLPLHAAYYQPKTSIYKAHSTPYTYTLGTHYHRAHVALRRKFYIHNTTHSVDVVCGPYTKEKKKCLTTINSQSRRQCVAAESQQQH